MNPQNLLKLLSSTWGKIYKYIFSGCKYVWDNFNRIYSLIIPMILFLFFGIAIISYAFKDLSVDTTYLTNYGFAIFVGISSVCFSWVRALDSSQQPKMTERITILGEISLHSGVQFLVASALKYSALHLEFMGFKSWTVIYIIVRFLLGGFSAIYFTTASYNAYDVLNGINTILFERFKEQKKY